MNRKAVGITLSGVIRQSWNYAEGLPDTLTAWTRPLPFLDQSIGVETLFMSGLDPESRSRRVFNFHRPQTLLDWMQEKQPLRARVTLPISQAVRTAD